MRMRKGIRSKAEHRFSNLRAVFGDTFIESQKEDLCYEV